MTVLWMTLALAAEPVPLTAVTVVSDPKEGLFDGPDVWLQTVDGCVRGTVADLHERRDLEIVLVDAVRADGSRDHCIARVSLDVRWEFGVRSWTAHPDGSATLGGGVTSSQEPPVLVAYDAEHAIWAHVGTLQRNAYRRIDQPCLEDDGVRSCMNATGIGVMPRFWCRLCSEHIVVDEPVDCATPCPTTQAERAFARMTKPQLAQHFLLPYGDTYAMFDTEARCLASPVETELTLDLRTTCPLVEP